MTSAGALSKGVRRVKVINALKQLYASTELSMTITFVFQTFCHRYERRPRSSIKTIKEQINSLINPGKLGVFHELCHDLN